MPRDYKVYLEDILEAVERILRYTSNAPAVDFTKDERTLDAVIRNLMVIGEAVKSVPVRVRRKYPEVEWRKVAGLRDVLIHQYFGIKSNVISDTVRVKIPLLKKQIGRIIAEDKG